jgi:hypothetical protein
VSKWWLLVVCLNINSGHSLILVLWFLPMYRLMNIISFDGPDCSDSDFIVNLKTCFFFLVLWWIKEMHGQWLILIVTDWK